MPTLPSSKSTQVAVRDGATSPSPDHIDLCARISEIFTFLLDAKLKLTRATDHDDKDYKSLIYDFLSNLVRF
jgi:hypothetical protein